MPKPEPILITPKPTPLPAEMFECTAEPGPWAIDADDVEVTVNETQRTYAGRDCRRQLRRVCLTLTVLQQVTGECPNGFPSSEPSSRTAFQE